MEYFQTGPECAFALPGAGQAICYLGLLRGFRRVKDAVADQIVSDFLGKYLAVTRLSHAVTICHHFYRKSHAERGASESSKAFSMTTCAQKGSERGMKEGKGERA